MAFDQSHPGAHPVYRTAGRDPLPHPGTVVSEHRAIQNAIQQSGGELDTQRFTVILPPSVETVLRRKVIIVQPA